MRVVSPSTVDIDNLQNGYVNVTCVTLANGNPKDHQLPQTEAKTPGITNGQQQSSPTKPQKFIPTKRQVVFGIVLIGVACLFIIVTVSTIYGIRSTKVEETTTVSRKKAQLITTTFDPTVTRGSTTTAGPCPEGKRSCNDGQCIKEAFWCDFFGTDCDDGSDEANCDCTGKFECTNSNSETTHCIFLSWQCDGDNDCGDYSDETNCTCDSGFECLDSKVCLKSTAKCDGYEECLDGSDEKNCTCSNSETECSDGTCILNEWFCDGELDCSDGGDEEGCVGGDYVDCLETQFACADHRQCIDRVGTCNGNADCSDGSDEWSCVEIFNVNGEEYNEVVLVILESNKTVPICATNWNSSWNDFICNEIGGGSAISNDTIPTSTDVPGTSGTEFAIPLANRQPTTSIIEVLNETVSPTCSSGLVTVRCSYDQCGTRAPQFSTVSRRKILEGYTAEPGSWPWQISLRYNDRHSCGGALISPGVILTAAHCVERNPNSPGRFDIWHGTINSATADDTLQAVIAKKIVMHEDYDTITLENDIAVVCLASNVTYTDYVRPVCLPESTVNFFRNDEYVECYTSGWGGLDDQAQKFPDYLQEAKMGLINDTVCGADPDIAKEGLYDDIMICAGYIHGYITVCGGDSGGPLVCRDKRNVWTLAGVTSWGPVDAWVSCKGISVYTEVSPYATWINNTVANHC